MERERGFDEAAALADLPDRERLKHHDLAVQLSEDFDSFPITLFGRRHARVRYQTSAHLYSDKAWTWRIDRARSL
jgi:hypothetical protein